MRRVREVLRLRHALGMSDRSIAQSLAIGKTTVGEYVCRAKVIGITWPVPEEIDDAELERRLFTAPSFEEKPKRPPLDWPRLHEELKRRGVTLMLLWLEYRANEPDGFGYSRFCGLYGDWRRSVSATMRQTHAAGEKLFVDFAGDTVAVFDPLTGDTRQAHIFVSPLGASNFTYAEARWSEGLPDWIGVHVGALAAIGGVPKAVVCDNLKAAVTKASRYEPGVNRTYQDLATHYGFAILPTRVRKPRDKAKVEVAVQIVQRFVLARLRNRRFFSLDDLNIAIRECVADLNAKIMRKLGKSRRELLETIERPALKALPTEPYRYAEWKRARVAPDYHVEIAGHFYSVPSRLIREVALGGRPAASFARRLMLAVSNDTLLRVVRRRGSPSFAPPTVVGIDDWAWRRNQRYGTIICDLERRKTIALLRDREPATAEAWLCGQPQISVVARDRGGGYALAAAKALPNAIQVADRWHLMENASRAFLDAVQKSMRQIRAAIGATTINPSLLTAAERIQYEGYLRREEANAAILGLAKDGVSIKEIVRRTGYSRGLVRNVLRGRRSDVFRARESSLEPSHSFLRTTPAKNPRTECDCQPVNSMMVAIVAPFGRRSSPSTRACLEFARVR